MVELGTADYQSSFVAVVKSGNLIITIICIKEVIIYWDRSQNLEA
jgi:hypothetical protein